MSQPHGYSRRTLLKQAGLLGGAAMLLGATAACGRGGGNASGPTATVTGVDAELVSHVNSDSIVFADYGGIVREARLKAYVDSFTAATRAKVVFADADAAKFVLQAQRGRGQWDAYDADAFEIVDYHNRGLLEELPSWVPRNDGIPAEFQNLTAGGHAYSYCQAYNSEQLGSATPETWADFWDVQKFPGKRAWPRFYLGTAEAALVADGVTTNLFPLDLDRAFAKMSELRDHMVFYETYADGVRQLSTGGASMGLLPNGRVFQAQKNGAPLKVVWNQALLNKWGGAVVPKGAPHADSMFAYLGWCSDPQRQAEYCKRTGYSPVVSKAYDYIDEALAAELPTSPDHLKVAIPIDPVKLSAQNAEYSEGYTRWLGNA